MTQQQRLERVLDDVVDGEPVGPASMPVALLADYQAQVARFLKGSHADVDLAALRVGIEAGSWKVVVPAMALVAGLASDVALLGSGNLDDMDPKRAEIIEEWQKAAAKAKTRRYDILPGSGKAVHIHARTHYARQDQATWVKVEKYLLGEVIDLGGKKPNVHLLLPDGTTVKVGTSHDQVLDQNDNLVYRRALLHVRAEEDLHTGTLRHVHLIKFAHYQPAFDSEAFAAMVAKGRKAWADVPDASEWVEEQRGAARSQMRRSA
jgi:hypothetical protein